MLDRGEHLFAVADVGDECRCFRTDFGDLFGDGVDAVRPHVDQGDVRAVAGQPQGDAAADSASASGDQGDLPVSSHSRCLLQTVGVDEHLHLRAGVQRLEALVDDVVEGIWRHPAGGVVAALRHQMR